jgi:hypothetical protein
MSLPLPPLPPAVGSAIGLPILDAQPPDLATALQQFASQFASGTAQVLLSINSAVIDIAWVAYVTCLLVGVLLYFTHVGRRPGKDMTGSEA